MNVGKERKGNSPDMNSEHSLPALEDAIKRRLLNQSEPSSKFIIECVYALETGTPSEADAEAGGLALPRRLVERQTVLPTVDYVANVIASSESQCYENVFRVISDHKFAFGVGALLCSTASELTSVILPLVASKLGRHEQEQLTTFCEEAVSTVHHGRVDQKNSHALAELKSILDLVQCSEQGNPADVAGSDWIRDFRSVVRIRSWYPDTLVGVLWVAMRMPGPPCGLLSSMCSKPLNCSASTASADDWKRALSVIPSKSKSGASQPQRQPGEMPAFDEPLASLSRGFTTAQLLTTTQSNYGELWTKMGWPCRRRVHEEILAIRKCWHPKSGMILCEALLRHIAE